VTEKLYNSNKRDLRQDVKDILLNDKKCSETLSGTSRSHSPRKKILLVDEVDVFFSKEFFGQYYTPSAKI